MPTQREEIIKKQKIMEGNDKQKLTPKPIEKGLGQVTYPDKPNSEDNNSASDKNPKDNSNKKDE